MEAPGTNIGTTIYQLVRIGLCQHPQFGMAIMPGPLLCKSCVFKKRIGGKICRHDGNLHWHSPNLQKEVTPKIIWLWVKTIGTILG